MGGGGGGSDDEGMKTKTMKRSGSQPYKYIIHPLNAMSPSSAGTPHKVVGLVSGGKDSCFNLMHCVANGHELIALATLQPPAGIGQSQCLIFIQTRTHSADELDSHLYQSVGTHLLPLIARSMNLPLYTRIIRGKAVDRGPEYGSRLRGGPGSGCEGDETEDLETLLQDVMAGFILPSNRLLNTSEPIQKSQPSLQAPFFQTTNALGSSMWLSESVSPLSLIFGSLIKALCWMLWPFARWTLCL